MNILLLGSNFLINSLFMMLTTLLPLFVYTATHSYADVGAILMVFTISVLFIRISIWKSTGNLKTKLFIGICFFSLTFVIFFFFFKNFLFYFLGAASLGIGVGLVPPILLTFLTSETNAKNNSKNIGFYNISIAVSAASAPLIGEGLYKHSVDNLLSIWLILALILVVIIIFINLKYDRNKISPQAQNQETSVTNTNDSTTLSFRIIILLLFLTAVSISYGTIISYLPIFFEKINTSIGIFYLVFWLFYSIAQENQYLNDNLHSFLLIIIGLILSMLFISYGQLNILIYGSGVIFGYLYGSIFKIYYFYISKIKNVRHRNNGYGIVGLMSYIGVGISQVFISPFLNFPIQNIFFLSSLYLIPFLILIPLLFWRASHGKKG